MMRIAAAGVAACALLAASCGRGTDATPALMAAVGMGGGEAWIQLDRTEREALTLDAVKLVLELGVDVNAFREQSAAAAVSPERKETGKGKKGGKQ